MSMGPENFKQAWCCEEQESFLLSKVKIGFARRALFGWGGQQ
jgi:hypothetical protein